MRVLVIQNYTDTDLGQVGVALAEIGAEIDRRKPYEGDALPEGTSAHEAMVILGGAQNALDDANCPYFPALLDLIRAFEAKDRGVLGICLGSQLIVRAFGGSNQIGGASEFGWRDVRLTGIAETDPVVGALPANFPIFQWHDDTFALPSGAVRLAHNEAAANQAFRIGRAVYGFQFHFEADRQMVREWSTLFAPQIAERHADWADRLDGEMERHGPVADAVGLAIARAWRGIV